MTDDPQFKLGMHVHPPLSWRRCDRAVKTKWHSIEDKEPDHGSDRVLYYSADHDEYWMGWGDERLKEVSTGKRDHHGGRHVRATHWKYPSKPKE